jgi:hypothetical protein
MSEEELDEIIITSDELKNLFKENILQDRDQGWFYKDTQIDIIALHKQEPKHIYDIANAQRYKIKRKEKRY